LELITADMIGDQRAAIAYDAHAAGDPKAEKCMAPNGITTAFGDVQFGGKEIVRANYSLAGSLAEPCNIVD
jgi:hypothetical protein